MPISYRALTTIEELKQFVALKATIWGLDERDVIPVSIMRPVTMHGGLALGAYDDAALVGLALAIPIRYEKNLELWSYITGVHPDYQGQQIGTALKRYQRQWALENLYTTIRWTYDPLQCGNANFNLHRLGVTANVYHIDYYGAMDDDLNAGLPSDRLEVQWTLSSGRVTALAEDNPGEVRGEYHDGLFILTTDEAGKPQLHTAPGNDDRTLFIEIPASINKLKRARPALAIAWRMALREALLSAFETGYRIVDFARDGVRCWYVLRPDTA